MKHRTFSRLSVASAAVCLMLLALGVAPLWAAAPADPYADAVAEKSLLLLNSDRVLGAPDGSSITMLAGLGNDLTLDMGSGEEGTGNLRVYYGALSVGLVTNVTFLDTNKQVIETDALSFVQVGINGGRTFAVVNYNSPAKPYRYVRFPSLVQVYQIDAIEATSYVGGPTTTPTPPTTTPTTTATPTTTPVVDTDGDGLPDAWEIQYGLDPLDATGNNGANGDPDNDGLTNLQEYTLGTNPKKSDTDNDGLPDGWEVQYSLDPLSGAGVNGANGDPDNDKLLNIREYTLGTNPQVADTDGDGLPDGWEVQYGLNPLSPNGNDGANGDPDNDGLTNIQEYNAGTNPQVADTDGDGLPDGWEVIHGLDPLNPDGNNGASGDPDSDGLTNGEEFASDTHPLVPNDPSQGPQQHVYLPAVKR